MPRALSILKLARVRPPVRRVLAIDAGSRCIKLLLAESDFGRLRLLKEEWIDLQAEGLVSADEIKAHLEATLEKWGRPPLALVLPQHLSTSQVIDLPLASEREVEKLIEDETIKLSGVSESRIVYDFVRTESPAKSRQQFWVTLCQEGDIRERILRLGIEHEDLCEVTTTANALIAAYRAACPLSSRAVLVHLGAETTVVAILLAGQGVFAASFQMGGDFFTRALARVRNCSEESAEALKRERDLLSGADPEFAAVVVGWVAELQRQLHEWFEHNPAVASEMASFELIASGGGFAQPGLLNFLKAEAGLDLKPWPAPSQPDAVSAPKRFEVAFGAVLQALGYSAQPVSLLPDDYRAAWRKRLGRQRLELASLALMAVCALILAAGTWYKFSLINRKEALRTKVRAAQEAVGFNEELTAELLAGYENLRPLFAGQQNTLDMLKSLALLQQSRSNRSFWYVLVADQQTYFNPSAALTATNHTATTNLTASASAAERAMALFAGASVPSPALTNAWPAKPGLIAELCFPQEAEGSRAVLQQLVNDLKQQPLFAKVDRLSEDLRQNLADPRMIIPDRRFVLALDFAETDFQASAQPKKALATRTPRTAPRRVARPAWPDETEKSLPTIP